MVVLRDIWEETSFQLERRQASPDCVIQEQKGLKTRREPLYKVPFDPDVICIVPKGIVTFQFNIVLIPLTFFST